MGSRRNRCQGEQELVKKHDYGVTVTFDEIPNLVGIEVVSPYRIIDQSLRKKFDEATLLTELEKVGNADELYPDDLLEGFHLLGLLDFFAAKYIDMDRAEMYGWNYGLNRVRFVSTMHSGKPLRFRATISRVEKKGEGYLVYMDCVLEHEGADRPGMVAEWIAYQIPIESGSKP